tara:strand:- start:40 stop:708 length:669 start_codon:yes stop_codon:yes gene_type:complete
VLLARAIAWGGGVRFLVLALFVGVLLSGTLLCFLAASNERFPGDLSVMRTIQAGFFPGEPFANGLRILTGTEVVVAIGLVFATISWLFGKRRPALTFAFGLAVVVTLQFSLKEIIDRPRPTPDLVDLRSSFSSASFPSGHAMSATYLYGFLALSSFAADLPSSVRISAIVSVVGLLALAGLVEVFLGMHWPSDVIGGYLWALAVLVPTAMVAFPRCFPLYLK